MKKAIFYLEKSANHNYKNAMFILAGLYLNGNKVKKDCLKASKLFIKLAHDGDLRGEYYLGSMYKLREYFIQNYKEAAKCHLKTAENGNQDAKAYLTITNYNNSDNEK